jgi:hypothetical protein
MSRPRKNNTEAQSMRAVHNPTAFTTQLIVRYPSSETQGCDPQELSRKRLAEAGHHAEPLLKVIRKKCCDCSGGQPSEVRKCTAVACSLWPYRMGQNPFAKTRGASFRSPKKPAQIAPVFGGNRPSNGDRARGNGGAA